MLLNVAGVTVYFTLEGTLIAMKISARKKLMTGWNLETNS